MSMKKLLCGMLAFALLIPLLVACKSGTDDPTPTPTQDPADFWSLIENGTATVSLIRSDLTGRTFNAMYAKFGNALKAATGCKELSITTDYVKRGSEVPTDTAEILIGETNRQESLDAYALLGENEYIIAVYGKRLVIIGQNEDATAEACKVFLRDYLGYDEESDTYSEHNLILLKTLSVKGVYIAPYIDPADPTEGLITHHEMQNKQTTTPAKYVTPRYNLSAAGYTQSYDPLEITGVMTTFQTNTGYSDIFHVHSDSVMVYATDNGTFDGWYDADNFCVDMMLAINRASSSYLSLDKSNYEDIQMDAGGKYIEHGFTGSGNYYMVPSEDWIEYCWANMIKPMIEYNHPQTIAMEEPEMWIRSGYSETFKKEWQAYFDEEWQDPTSSPEATLKSNLLKTYLFERIITVMAQRIKKLAPGTQVYIATHSTVNYSAWSIDAGINHYLALGVLDGVIGQTWSDTHNSAFPYAGKSYIDNFTNAFIEYSSYMDSVEGTNFYALADPMADSTSVTEADCQYFYRQSVVASLMQPEINRFQILPWVQRAYANVSGEYRTIQSQIFEALNEIGGKSIEMTAGTPGITYLISDSLSWMNTGNNFTLRTTDGMYGICASLIREGIPTKMKSMDQITCKEDLDGVTVLVVSFDSNVPLDEKVNVAISDWVKAGGTLLLATGSNEYWDIDNYFFWNKEGSPLNNLFKHLGLTSIKATALKTSATAKLSSSIDIISDEVKGRMIPNNYQRFTIAFEGAKNSILKLGNQTIGFEEDVGNGHVLAVGLPSAVYATNEGEYTIEALVAYALANTDFDYTTSDMMVTKRGRFTAAHAFDTAGKLTGQYIDLYTPDLQILTNPTVPANDSVFYVDLSNYDLSVPRLGFSAGNLVDGSLSETADKLAYRLTSAANTTVSNRILLPSGVYPASISIKADDNEQDLISFYYEEATSSVFFSFEGSPAEYSVEMTFSKNKSSLPTIQYLFNETSITINKDGADSAFIYENTASANSGLRFCDLDTYLIYKFDLKKYADSDFRFTMSQNYIVEVSGDAQNWTIVADVSNGGKIGFGETGNTAAIVIINPNNYKTVSETLYVRMRNPFTSYGSGAAVSRLTIRTRVTTQTVKKATLQPGYNNTTQKPAKNPLPEDSDAKYLVSTDKNGIKHYRRSMNVNSSNLDAEFIYMNTSFVNDGMRYCDNNTKLVYLFSLEDMRSFSVTIGIFQNYYVEISNDGEEWMTVADYSQGGTVPHIQTGANKTSITIDADDCDAFDTDALYVRVSNCNPSMGWGGSVTSLTLNYTR